MKKNKIIWLLTLLAVVVPVSVFAAYGDTTKYLGQLYAGDGKKATEAYFDFPEDMCADGNGNFYIADTYNHVIRKINKKEIVSTYAGSGSIGDEVGPDSQAEFSTPTGIDCDSNGNVVVADTGNDKIKKIKNDQVYTLVDGLNKPEGVKLKGSTVYFLDTGNNTLKKVSLSGGNATTVATGFNGPKKLDILGNYAYVTDSLAFNLVKVNLSSGSKEIIAGMSKEGNRTGTCSRTKFRNLWGVSIRNENEIYVSDGTGNVMDTEQAGRGIGFVVKIDLSDGCTTEVFADDENMVSLNFPNGMDIYNNYLYVASTGIGLIYNYNLDDANDNGKFAGANRFGSRNGTDPLLGRPHSMVQHPKNKKYIYYTENNKIRRINTKKNKIKFIVGHVVDNYPSSDTKWYKGNKGRFSDPRGLAFSKKGKWLYVADRNNNRIRKVNTKTRKVGYFTGAGDTNAIGEQDNGYREGKACPNQFNSGKKKCAYFNRPTGLAIDNKKGVLYVSDTDNNVIRKVFLKGKKKGKTRLVAGSPGNAGFADGTKKDAKFDVPFSIVLNKKKTALYVADRDNHSIRKIRVRDGRVTTVAGKGSAGYEDGLFENAEFSYPVNLAFKNRMLYVSEVGGQMIRVLDLKNGVVKLVAGSGEKGYRSGTRKSARFYNPNGIVAKKNFLFIADDQNDLIRKVDIRGEAPYTDAAPTVSECAPKSLKYSDYPTGKAMIEIHGSNFRYGAKAYFGSYEVTTFVQSDSSLAVEVPIGSMAAGYYEVKVMNNDGQNAKLLRGFSAQEYSGNIPNTDYWTD